MDLSRLLAFMTERHRIYLARAAGEPGPWTEDEILRTYRFTNVYRELDRVTVWIRENVREPFANSEHLWFMLAIARYVNWPETLAELIETRGAWPEKDFWSAKRFTEVLAARAARGEKVYTGAYVIRAESDRSKEWYSWSKHRYIAEIILGRLWEDRTFWGLSLSIGLSLHQVWDLFQEPRYVGWGPFMAYEVVTDLRWTRYLRGAPDVLSWANAGPGALRGLNRLLGQRLSHPLRPADAAGMMREILGGLDEGWPGAWPRLEMRDVEHSLCEFDKYERVRLGEGRPRALFRG